MSCTYKYLANDVGYNCEIKPVAGTEARVLFVNINDIDKANSVISANNELVLTDIVLKANKTGVLFEAIEDENDGGFEMKDDKFGQFYEHVLNLKLLTPSAENRLEAKNIASGGGKYIAIIERKWKGVDSKDAFQVYGWQYGLKGSVHKYNTKENDGAELITLKTPAPYMESNPALQFLKNASYTDTLSAFDNKLA